MKDIKSKNFLLLLMAICFSFSFRTAYSQDIKSGIIGSWISSADSSSKMEFLENGELKYYRNATYLYSEKYFIVDECDGESLHNGQKFLRTIDADGNFKCNYINSINMSGNGELLLTEKQDFRMLKYLRVQK